MIADNWQQSSGKNVFEMYISNGGPGFWIRRTTWGATCARIIRVGKMTKPAPYFGNPSVLMDVYTLEGTLKQGLAQAPVPGTYKTWRKIPPPSWAERAELRPLDDAAIDNALQALDRKRHKVTHGSQSPLEDVQRIPLSVPFSQREQAKRIGAKWSPAEKVWWLPARDTRALSQARALGFLSETVQQGR
jgi:hypothetical protein